MEISLPRGIWGYRSKEVKEILATQASDHERQKAALQAELAKGSAETARLKLVLAELEREHAALAARAQDEMTAMLRLLNGIRVPLEEASQRAETERNRVLLAIQRRQTDLAKLGALQERFMTARHQLLAENRAALTGMAVVTN